MKREKDEGGRAFERRVLAELDAAQAENELLRSKVARLEALAEAMASGGLRERDLFRAHCLAVGRRDVARNAVSFFSTWWRARREGGGGEPATFGEWCRAVVERRNVPGCISMDAFLEEMEPELRALWEEERERSETARTHPTPPPTATGSF